MAMVPPGGSVAQKKVCGLLRRTCLSFILLPLLPVSTWDKLLSVMESLMEALDKV